MAFVNFLNYVPLYSKDLYSGNAEVRIRIWVFAHMNMHALRRHLENSIVPKSGDL